MPVVLITPEAMREQPHPYVPALLEAGFEIRYPKNPQFARGLGDAEEMVAELQGVHASIASGERYSREVLARLPQLRVIARAGVGYDRVDVSAATDHRVAITITPTSNHEAVAELAMALLFGVTKSIVSNDRRVRSGEWPRKLLMPMRGRTFGLVGLGRIGRSTALRAKALGMRVIAYETHPLESFVREHEIELVSFDEVVERSDFLSVHCPLTDATRGMFNRSVFSRMKPGSVFLNTARGPLMNEADLYEALTSGHLRGAGLDVYQQEPPSPDNPLFQLDNVVLSPHLAGTDEESLVAMGVEAADCIIRLSRGEWPEGAVVNAELREGWQW